MVTIANRSPRSTPRPHRHGRPPREPARAHPLSAHRVLLDDATGTAATPSNGATGPRANLSLSYDTKEDRLSRYRRSTLRPFTRSCRRPTSVETCPKGTTRIIAQGRLMSFLPSCPQATMVVVSDRASCDSASHFMAHHRPSCSATGSPAIACTLEAARFRTVGSVAPRRHQDMSS